MSFVYCPECGWIIHSDGCDNKDCINYSPNLNLAKENQDG